MVDEVRNSKLTITDGDIKVNLFDIGFSDWIPQTAPWKDGGVFSDSPFSDKTALIARQFTSTADTFSLQPSGFSQDIVIKGLLDLQTLLEKAVAYQMSRWQNEPVWIEACGENETNKRYALITAYQMPQLDNPFRSPFSTIDEELVMVEDFTLVVNHEIWQSEPPGLSHCVLGNGIQIMDSLESSELIVPITSLYDNAFYYNSEDEDIVPPIAGSSLVIGYYTFHYNNILIFRNVQLNHFDKIVTAHIDFVACADSGAGNELVRITGLKNRGDYVIMPNKYNPEEIARMPRTNVYVDVTIGGAWTTGTTYQVSGIAPIIQEIINDPDWVSGSDICLILDDNGTAYGQAEKFACAVNPTAFTPPEAAPQLHIDAYFPQNCLMGQEDTCEDHVFVANKHNRAQITDVMTHAATPIPPYPPEWQAWETCLDPLPHHLFPDVPGVGDTLYVGIRTTAIQTGPFSSIIFDLDFPYANQPSGITGMTYKYYDKVAAAWVALPANTYYDETRMFNVAGVRGFYFIQPANMWHTTINGIDAYWIEFAITAGHFGRMPNQVNRPVYTINTPYFEIPASSGGGDISTIAKTKFHARLVDPAEDGVYYYYPDYLAIRSMVRGIDFTPYLNCTSVINQVPGLTCADLTGDSSIIADPAAIPVGSPTGYLGLYDPGHGASKAKTEEFKWHFDDTLATQYKGKFAFYLRYQLTNSSANVIKASLQFLWGGMSNFQTDEIILSDTIDATYLGTFDLSLGGVPGERFFDYSIGLMLSVDLGVLPMDIQLYIYDLVLVPVDEFVILNNIPEWDTTTWQGTGLVVDSIDYPKDLVRVHHFNPTNDDLTVAIEYFMVDMWRQQNGHQRLWYFSFGADDIRNIHCPGSIQQFAVNRYALGMRGAK